MMFSLSPFHTLVWRCFVYALVLLSWSFLVRQRVPNKPAVNLKLVIRRSRKKLIVLIVVFELIVVQNGLWPIFLFGWGLLYGR